MEPLLPEGLARVNRLLCQDIPDDRFVTAFFGVLKPERHELEFISAGHGPVLVIRSGSGTIEQLPIQGLPLGVAPDLSYARWERTHFDPGDVMIALTDGFAECEDQRGNAFGIDRIAEILAGRHRLSAVELIEELYRELLVHAQGSGQSDDLTAVVIRKT